MRKYKYRSFSAFRKNILRSLTGHVSRFLAVFAIIALGAGVYAGLRMFVPDMYDSADSFYDQLNFHDVQVTSTVGLTDADLERIAQVEGVRGVMGAKQAEVSMSSGDQSYQVVLTGVDMRRFRDMADGTPGNAGDQHAIDRYRIIEGRLPEAPDEIAINKPSGQNIQLGDTLTVDSVFNFSDPTDMLSPKRFTVVGFVVSPVYISESLGLSSQSGLTLTNHGHVDISAFADPEIYTDALVTVDSAFEQTALTEKYMDSVRPVRNRIKEMAQNRAQTRYDTIFSDANAELSDAQTELDDGRREADEKIGDAEVELADARQKLDDGWAQLEQGEIDAASGQRELNDAKALLDSSMSKLLAGQIEYDQGLKTYLAEKAAADAKFAEAQQQIDSGWAQLNDAKAQLDAGAAQLAQGWSDLDAAKAQRADLVNQKADLEQQLVGVNATISDLENQLPGVISARDGLQSQLDDINNQLNPLLTQQASLQSAISTLTADINTLNEQIAALEGSTDPADIALQAQLISERDGLISQRSARQVELNSLNEAIAPLEAGKTELEAQIASLNSTIDTMTAGLEEAKTGKAALEQGIATIDQGIAQLDAGIASGQAELEQQQQVYDQSVLAYEKAYAETAPQLEAAAQQLADGKAALNNAKAILDSSKQELDAGWEAYYSGLAAYNEGIKKLEDARALLVSSREELDQGEIDYTEGMATLERERADAQEELADGQKKIDDARAELEDIPDPLWYVLDRTANYTYTTYKANAGRMNQITTIFPIFFFLVAALVVLTTMTRMVDAERIEIGTLKALGFTRSQITRKYLTFAVLASVFGSIVGIVIMAFILPLVIWVAYDALYQNLPFLMKIHPRDSLIAFGLSVGITILVTVLSTRLVLRERPASLMLPRAPEPGKRILLERIAPLWSRLRFSLKVTARNLFRYKKRLIMTILGVAGCTGLLLAGFGIQNKLDGFVQKHYNEILTYNMTVNFQVDDDPAAAKADHSSSVAKTIESKAQGSPWIFAASIPAIAENPTGSPDDIPYGIGGDEARTGGSAQATLREARSDRISEKDSSGIMRDITIVVPEDMTRLSEFASLHTFKKQEPIDIKPGSVAISQRLSEILLIKPGDQIYLSTDPDDEAKPITVQAIFEYYDNHEVYMDRATYEDLFGKAPEFNSVWIKSAGTQDDRAALGAEIRDANAAVKSVILPESLYTAYIDLTSSLNGVVFLIIGVSAALAFIVLYNLTNINIEERAREIATLKVLGFFPREVDAYIFRETVLLSFIGTLVGLPLGVWLCNFIMRSAELDSVMFFRDIQPLSFVLAVVLTMFFTFVVMAFMHGKLKHIDMVSSLKANE